MSHTQSFHVSLSGDDADGSEATQQPQELQAAEPQQLEVRPGTIDLHALFPPTTAYRRAIVTDVLPHLVIALKDPVSRLRAPRDIVVDAVEKCKGSNLWGKYGVFTRKRTVVDSILTQYFHCLQNAIANS